MNSETSKFISCTKRNSNRLKLSSQAGSTSRKMTDKNTLADYNIKDFDKSSSYILCSKYALDSYPYNINGIVDHKKTSPGSSYVTFCQVCGWYGYPHEKIIVEFEGIRPEDEDGFIDKFTEYDYDAEVEQKKAKHIHKCNPELVQELVDLALELRN
jgi:hypothetical protein